MRFLPRQGAEEVLQSDNAPKIDENERRGERAIDEGAVDDDVYVVEAVAEDGYANSNVQAGDGYGVEQVKKRFR